MAVDLTRLKKSTTELADSIDRMVESNTSRSSDTLTLITVIFDNLTISSYIVTPEYRLLYINPYARKVIAEKLGRAAYENEICYSTMFGLKLPCPGCLVGTVMKSKYFYKTIVTNLNNEMVELFAIPISDNGVKAVLVVPMNLEIKNERFNTTT